MKVSKLMAAMLCCAVASTALAQSDKPKMPDMPRKMPEGMKPDGMKKEVQPADKSGAPKMGGDDMAAMMKAGTPGDMHQWLSKGSGTWDATIKMMMPGQPATESKGTMTNEMVMGGRFSHSMFKGDFMGMPFEGAGALGYNNTTGKFESTWMDNMSTATSHMTGELDKDHKVLTLTGETMDPSTKKMRKEKEVFTVKSDNETMMEFYSMVDGKDTKMMEIDYTRAKGSDKGATDKVKDEMDRMKKKMEDAMPKK